MRQGRGADQHRADPRHGAERCHARDQGRRDRPGEMERHLPGDQAEDRGITVIMIRLLLRLLLIMIIIVIILMIMIIIIIVDTIMASSEESATDHRWEFDQQKLFKKSGRAHR